MVIFLKLRAFNLVAVGYHTLAKEITNFYKPVIFKFI